MLHSDLITRKQFDYLGSLTSFIRHSDGQKDAFCPFERLSDRLTAEFVADGREPGADLAVEGSDLRG